MTVTGQFRTDVRPYSGYVEPGLPIASYIAQAGIVGDASGGNVIIDFNFQFSEDARISELFNLEQLSFDTSSGLARVVMMETRNMDALSPARAGSPQKWQFTTLAAAGDSATPLSTQNGLPIWLGAPNQDAPSGAGGLRFQVTNIDLLLYACTIQGFMWGPRSVMTPGGPRRPLMGFMR